MAGENDSGAVTVIVADDHAVVRKGLMAFFDATDDIRVLATASTAQEAVEAAGRLRPQVVLLDLLLPDQKAVVTIRQIREVAPATEVLVLTSHEGGEFVEEVFDAGALSYLLKDISPEDLIAAVRMASRGEPYACERVAALREGSAGEGDDLYNRLTEREKEVLQLIARGLTNGEITERLFISETTVKSHVSNILNKLYLGDRTKLAVYAWKRGLMRKEPDNSMEDE